MKLKNNKGVTGVDIAIAVVILTIFVSVIASLFYNTGSTAKKVERKSGATNIAIEVIEGLKIVGARDFSVLTPGMDIDEINALNSTNITVPNGYTVEIGIEDYKDENIVKILRVAVKYPDGKNMEEVYIESLVKNGEDEGGSGSGGVENPIAGKKYEDETDITVDGTPVTVPGKFTVSGLEEESTIEDGLVIYLVPDGTTVNWNDSTEVEYAQKNYDQFVWVPVPNAIAKDKNSDGTIDETDIDLMIADEEYPMAIATDETNYRGILYDFALTDGKVTVSDKNWSATSTSYREPAYLTNSNYADASSYNNVGITESLLQSEFNTMVNKVSNKKGFWVGRYETSNMSSSNANDSSQQIKVIKGTTAGINNVNWYRMYAQQKSYSKLALGTTTTVTSSMIWGSQWDQIMIWMKTVKNTINTTNGEYYVINAVGMGNYGTSDDSDTSTSEPAPTGNSEKYKVKNVYDLAGNVYDWSLEADNPDNRVLRGGNYTSTHRSDTRAYDRSNVSFPSSSGTNSGSRASLY